MNDIVGPPAGLQSKAERPIPLLGVQVDAEIRGCLLYTSPSPRDRTRHRMPSSA